MSQDPRGRHGGPARVAAVAGAAGSAALVLIAGRTSPRLVLSLIVLWVISPFACLLGLSAYARRWPAGVGVAITALAFVLAILSLAIYGLRLVRPLGPHPASAFIGTPILSFVLIAAVLLAATLRARAGSAPPAGG